MLRLSKLTDYAVVVLTRLSAGAVQTCPGIAAATGLPEPTVAKVLKALAGDGLVLSQRGARGGYQLARALTEISVTDVVEAIDGPIALAACVEGSTMPCETMCQCGLHGRWQLANDAVHNALAAISLFDLVSAPGSPVSAPIRPASAGAALSSISLHVAE